MTSGQGVLLMKWRALRRLVMWVVQLGLPVIVLAGCAIETPTPLIPTFTPAATLVLPLATPSRQVISSLPATLSPTPAQIEPSATEIPGQRPVSGWTFFSNPDFVNGVAVEHNRVWAATGGGVTVWNMLTGQKQVYTTSDGLVEIQANDVVYCPLPEERLVVAHEAGVLSVYSVSRKKWDQIPITFTDGSSLAGVQTLACDLSGERLVAGARNGLGILDLKTRAWKRMDQVDGLALEDIRSLEVRGQTMWLAAGKVGGYLILGKTAFALNRESGLPSGDLNDVALAPDGNVWMGYPTGLVRYKDRVWTPYGSTSPNGIPFRSVDQVEISPDGEIWIASANEGVCPFDAVKLQCPIIYPDPPNFPYTDLITDALGTFVGTDGDGIRALVDEQVRRMAFETGQLSSNQVYDFAEDGEGRLWVATARGVDIFDPAQPELPWEHISSRPNQLAAPTVKGLQAAKDGMWFYYQNQPQASFFDGHDWRQMDSFRGITGEVQDTAVDQRGYVWFATDQGINIWDGISMRGFDSSSIDLPTNRFQALLALDGDMWAGTDRGLLRYHKFAWETVLPGASVQAIASDGAGGLLIGTDSGLIRFREDQGYIWIINLGEEAYLTPNITEISLDKQGNIWVGSAGDGLFLFDGHAWQHFTTANGLPANTIQSIYVDRLGGVWIAAAGGGGGGAVVRYMP